MDLFGVRLGFGFSAGLFDYVLNFSGSTRPWMLLPIGVAYTLDGAMHNNPYDNYNMPLPA